MKNENGGVSVSAGNIGQLTAISLRGYTAGSGGLETRTAQIEAHSDSQNAVILQLQKEASTYMTYNGPISCSATRVTERIQTKHMLTSTQIPIGERLASMGDKYSTSEYRQVS